MGASVVKETDDAVRHIRELSERWDNEVSEHGLGFSEKYRRGVFDFWISYRWREQANYRFAISSIHERSEGVGYSGNNDIAVPCKSPDLESTGLMANTKKSRVFSGVVELVEGVEQIIPSFVRLDSFETFSNFNGTVSNKLSPSEISSEQKILPTVSNGKVDFIRIADCVTLRESHGENIERASDSVDVRAHFGTESQWQRLFFDCDKHLMSMGIRFIFSNSGINITCQPFAQSALKGWEIGFGPFNRS